MSEPTAISASALNTVAATPQLGRKVKTLYRDLKLAVEYLPIENLRAYKRALRTHSPAHIEQLEASIQAFGFVQPILIDADGEIVGGHGMGLEGLPSPRRAGRIGMRRRESWRIVPGSARQAERRTISYVVIPPSHPMKKATIMPVGPRGRSPSTRRMRTLGSSTSISASSRRRRTHSTCSF